MLSNISSVLEEAGVPNKKWEGVNGPGSFILSEIKVRGREFIIDSVSWSTVSNSLRVSCAK